MQGLCTKAGELKGVASKTIYFTKVSLSCSVPCMLQGPPPPKKQTNRGKIPWIFQQGVDLFEKFLPPPGALFFKSPFSGSRSRLVRWRMAKGAGGGLRNFDDKRWDFPWPYQFSRGCIYILYIYTYIYISAFKSYLICFKVILKGGYDLGMVYGIRGWLFQNGRLKNSSAKLCRILNDK